MRSTRAVMTAVAVCVALLAGTAHAYLYTTVTTNVVTCRHVGAYGRGYGTMGVSASGARHDANLGLREKHSLQWRKQRLTSNGWLTVWNGNVHYGEVGRSFSRTATVNFSSNDVGYSTRVLVVAKTWQLTEGQPGAGYYYRVTDSRALYGSSCKVW